MTHTPPPTSFNLAAYVLQHAASQPDKIALSVVGDTPQDWTYATLERTVRGLAAGFLDMGLVPGARILMRLGNTPDFPIVFLAAIAADLIPIPTSAQLTQSEITQIANDTHPALIVAGPDIALPDSKTPILTQNALAALSENPAAPFATGDPNRAAYIIYTSGTSGRPRAVVHAHRAIWARRMMWDGWYGLRADDRLLHAGAFNWTYTLGTGLMDPWAIGATALIPAEGTPADALPQLLAAHSATIFAAAPGVYRRLLRAAMPPLPALRHGLSAGEKLPEVTRTLWTSKTGTAVHEAFGMSECSTFISGSPTSPAPEESLGYAQPGRNVALITPDGPAPDGTPGIIAIHRTDPGLMLGYLNQPDDTAARYQGDWFLTGDIGVRLPGGAIHYAGRNDDMMNAGGYRVSPLEVEAAIASHPLVQEVAACEVRINPTTTIIAAFYVAAEDISPSLLQMHAAQTLSPYKCPRHYVRIQALPRNPNGKVQRKALRDGFTNS